MVEQGQVMTESRVVPMEGAANMDGDQLVTVRVILTPSDVIRGQWDWRWKNSWEAGASISIW